MYFPYRGGPKIDLSRDPGPQSTCLSGWKVTVNGLPYFLNTPHPCPSNTLANFPIF